jgi:hypothetical protein
LRIGFGFSTFCQDAGAVQLTSLGPLGAAGAGAAVLGEAAACAGAAAGGADALGSGVLLQDTERRAAAQSAAQAPIVTLTDRRIILSTLPFCR